MTRALPALRWLGACVAPRTPAPPPAVAAAPVPPVTVQPVAPIALQGKPEQGGVAFGNAPAGATELRFGGEPLRIDGDGRFVIGFDRDAPPLLMLEGRLSDGRTLSQPVRIAPRAWAIERVAVPKRPGVTNAEFERLRAPEVARIAAARATVADASGWRQRFMWPAGGRISGVFGSQRIYRGGEAGAYHSGVDIAAPAGTPVTAPADGVARLAAADKPFTLEGHLLIVDHGGGLNSAFLHLSRIDVREGEQVRQGQRVGAIGASGRTTGPHLHWAVKWRGARVDPVALAGPPPGMTLRGVPVVGD